MAEASATINLRVLSPSTEVEGGLNFVDLSAAVTIRELRQRIQDAAPSRPTPDRMRLIYRGRVVANDNDSLQDIFGLDNIRESKDQSLHLVLRELPSSASAPSPAPRSSTAPPNPLQPGAPQSPLQANPFRTIPDARPNTQPPPQAPQPHHHHHHHHPHHHHFFRPPPPRPGPLAPIMNPLPPQFPHMPLPPHLQQQFAQVVRDHEAQRLRDGQAQGQQAPQGQPTGLPDLPGGHNRVIRREGIGPNGERWTVTTANIAFGPNQPMLPQPFPLPANGLPTDEQLQTRLAALRNGLPVRASSPLSGNVPDQMLQLIRRTMEHARQELENVRVLLQPPGGQATANGASAAADPPAWRMDQIRLSVRNLIAGLDDVDRGLATLAAYPLMAQNRGFVSLQESASDLRRQATLFNESLNQNSRAETSDRAFSTTAPASASAQAQQGAQPPSSDVPTELFILSSPQGPVGIVFDQRGTYSTGPTTMPFQAFSQQFNANRLQLGHLGRQMGIRNPVPRLPAHVLHPLAAHPILGQQPTQNANQAHVPDQNANQNANANANAPNLAQPAPAAPAAAAAQGNRVDNIAGHLWLIFKLAVFVYFFAAGGGWYRPIMICIIAGIVYLAQVGMFEEHFTAVRQYLETHLPPGILGLPELAGPAAANHRANRAEIQHIQPNRNPTPEEAARRLQQQHQDQRIGWVRQTVRTTERAVAIFVASLWPGIGERMVQAQEERVRAERAAEEERQAEEERRREEQQKKEQEAAEAKHEDSQDAADETAASASSSKGKGKTARVEDADGDVD
ncbi:hypothetical protein BU23DRAFT_551786 [Bimuria novae-zelandiae CBS 107.79]|uniref:Ubiquitin-like domain-containing protein n=1 Tax=Bimuria novae-zelandiae CBS 107.79 TaxID=1447943 RepID=A0A6A5VSW3_9PLEO|nr:hypothetical protein BU23DRAFT_551786 [Bimuria novae-zelandiae CBS 107.79]